MNNLTLFILVVFVSIIVARWIGRGYFWKDRAGNHLTLKQFLKRWKKGALELTPVQQTRIVLWSFLPIFAGLIWGIIVTFIGGTYWLTLILGGSLPITSIQFISNLQKYKAQKKADEAFRSLQNG